MSSDLAKLIAAADNAWPSEEFALLVFAGVGLLWQYLAGCA
jgi:hypothetical protein